jgi:hypothetical protein
LNSSSKLKKIGNYFSEKNEEDLKDEEFEKKDEDC